MRIELTEAAWFEEHVLSLVELCEISGLPQVLLEELVHAGAIAPLAGGDTEARFGAAALHAARNARRLREDFELDTPALLLALGLLDRLQEMERRLRELEARLPQRLRG
jgi:chaperone modulatory protein CbpM